MKSYANSKTVLVADVDCTAGGEELCSTHGVEGYPTIKWGDPSALEDYEGERELEDLKTFAKENLKPSCSPANIDLCDEGKKKMIADLQALSDEELDSKIEALETDMKEISANFDAEVEKLQAKYEELEKEKADKLKAAKDKGLGIMKSVKASKDKATSEL